MNTLMLCALDLETDSLEAKHDPNVPIHTVSLTFKRYSGEFVTEVYDWDVGGREAVRGLVRDQSIRFLIHNAAFDVAVLRTHGIDIPPGRYLDTMLMSYVWEPGSEGHSLEAWGHKLNFHKMDYREQLIDDGLISANAPKGFEFRINEHEHPEKSRAVMRAYNQRDTEVTYRVYDVCWQRLQTDRKLLKAYLDIELPYVEVIMEMEATGLYVDVPKAEALQYHLCELIEEGGKRIAEYVKVVPSLSWNDKNETYEYKAVEYKKGYSKNRNNIKHYEFDGKLYSSEPSYVYDHCDYVPFNPNSVDHLAYVLMKDGWTPETFSKKTGKATLDATVIDSIADEYLLARLVANVNGYRKLLSTFVSPLINERDERGFIHPSFNQCVTKTTRLSSSKPNAQNLPTRSELGKKVRECIVAPPGYSIVVGDLDGVELRVFAYYLMRVCGERSMLDAVLAGADLHQVNADKWGITRSQAKTVIFALLYGATAKRLTKTMKCTEEEAQKIIDAVYQNCPAIEQLIKSIHFHCRNNNGVLHTALGNRLIYPDINSRSRWERSAAERESQNSVIQGTAAGINKELMLRAQVICRKYGARLACVVHDEVIVYVPVRHVPNFLAEINEVYQCTDILKGKDWHCPVTATFAAGKDWVAAKAAG